ncbi:MAG: putative sugar O-methyltransferase [Nitrospirales bacterium]
MMKRLQAMTQHLLNKGLELLGYQAISKAVDMYEWQKNPAKGRHYRREASLPDGAEEYLHYDNPRYRELEDRYAKCHPSVTNSIRWKQGHVRHEDVLYFRGDNAFVHQRRGLNMNTLGYALSTYYMKAIDTRGLLEKLDEDDYFGNFIFKIDNKLISRDLLDSICETYFLSKHLDLSGMNILDIGAGYGRLAHRLVSATPTVNQYFCTDAIAVSTFISEFYTQFRRMNGKVSVIPLDEIEDVLESNSIHMALNIHSFSECRMSAIEYWLSLLVRHSVPYLMLIPNERGMLGKKLVNKEGQDMKSVIDRYGYRLMIAEPKYEDPIVQQYGMSPTMYYLFRLR